MRAWILLKGKSSLFTSLQFAHREDQQQTSMRLSIAVFLILVVPQCVVALSKDEPEVDSEFD
jgi:hypothetical protein